MAYNPQLGYDPDAVFNPDTRSFPSRTGSVAQTQQQWIADVAAQITMDFANGVNETNPLWAATFWQQAGAPVPPEGTFGAVSSNPNNAVPPSLYTSAEMLATFLFNNPQLASQYGMPGGAGQLPSVQVITPTTASQLFNANQTTINNAFTASENAKAEAAAAARNASSVAGQVQAAGIGAAANVQGAQISAAAQIEAAKIRAEVDREAIASGERVAGLDRTSREGIATADRQESGRQFDLRLGEDRRQFNATMIFNLYDRAVELSRRPVDWIAHQYFMENMGIPLSFLNLGSVANLLGAIPPTGPSEMGPMVGGPGIADGDTQLAQAAQVPADTLGFVPLSRAVQDNPGLSETYGAAATASTIQQTTGMTIEQLDMELAVARTEALPQVVEGTNPFVEQALTAATAVMQPQPAVTDAGTPFAQLPALDPTAGVAPNQITPPPVAAPAAGPVTATPSTTTNAPEGIYTGEPVPTANTAAAAVSPFATVASGVPAAVSANQPNPQGELLLQQMAAQLQMPVEELRKVMPTHLLAGGYSKEAIMNSPVIQALVQGKSSLSGFRTAPVEGTPFANIQGLGIPLGVRGGQDINYKLWFGSNPDQREMLQGAVEGAGMYTPTVENQIRRSSPFTDLPVGSTGYRRF